MAGPIASKIILPDDASNTGPKTRTQTIVVGADTVHSQFIVQSWQAKILGVYRFLLDTRYTVLQTAQNGTTAGILFIHMPSAVTGKKARIRRLSIQSAHTTVLATPTSPRVKATRYTSAGALSASLLVPNEIDQTYSAPSLLFSAANTGTTVVHVSHLGAVAVVGALTAVAAYAPLDNEVIRLNAPEDEWEVLAPGEGLVIWQDVNGTASDTRIVQVALTFDEVDTA